MKLIRLVCATGVVLVSGGCAKHLAPPPVAPQRVAIQNSTAAPLILVDGRVTDSAEINQIDPSHIDRVEVLKGAAAIERYGAGAVNGVILITLKQAI